METAEADLDGRFSAGSLDRRVVERLTRFERATRRDRDRPPVADDHG